VFPSERLDPGFLVAGAAFDMRTVCPNYRYARGPQGPKSGPIGVPAFALGPPVTEPGP
jgi:hypothetical protein